MCRHGLRIEEEESKQRKDLKRMVEKIKEGNWQIKGELIKQLLDVVTTASNESSGET